MTDKGYEYFPIGNIPSSGHKSFETNFRKVCAKEPNGVRFHYETVWGDPSRDKVELEVDLNSAIAVAYLNYVKEVWKND